MKRLITILLSAAFLVGAACEYTVSINLCNKPVYAITGVNSPNNLITQWTVQPDEEKTSGIGTLVVTETYTPFNLVRKEISPVHLPLTIYVSNLGWKYSPIHPDVPDTHRITLQYRVYPETEWTTAKSAFMIPPDHSDILNASLPEKRTFTLTTEKTLAAFGSYCIDLDTAPAANTLMQLRLEIDRGYEVMGEVSGIDNAEYLLERIYTGNPSSYFAEPLMTLTGNVGDWVTIQLSGKRRPRHDQ